jgi:hypothetical protein
MSAIVWQERHSCIANSCYCARMQVVLEVDSDVKAARIVKGRLERTTLGQVAASMAINLRPGEGGHDRIIRGSGTGLCHGACFQGREWNMSLVVIWLCKGF